MRISPNTILTCVVFTMSLAGCFKQETSTVEDDETARHSNSNQQRGLHHQFVSARIARYYSSSMPPDGRLGDEERTTVITDPDEVKRLASFFPGVGEKKVSPNSGGWEKYADIWFVRANGDDVRLSVSPGLDAWAEGHGEWSIPDADSFRSYFLELLKE